MLGLEIVPIGAFLALLAEQVLRTALAAKDVVIEKESFKILSKYLSDIEPVLKELQLRELKDSQAVRHALESLKSDINKAKELVEKYKNRARFYLLIKCRQIVKEVQDVTRNIGKSLASLSLASSEVLSDMTERVHQLHHEMQKAEFEASLSQVRIVKKLQQGLKEHKTDQGFANDLLEEIARAVGVPVEPLEINKEIASFKREKEEAAARKERAEACFLEQVIALLSRADAVNDQEEVEMLYFRRVQTIEKFTTEDDHIPPFRSFICPIGGKLMIDPASLCTGTTCERACIKAWIDSGHTTDPETGEVLDDVSLRPNIRLKESIEEWQELNYCLKIRNAKSRLLSGMESHILHGLNQIQELTEQNAINKDWIATEGMISIILPVVGSSQKSVKETGLVTLMGLVKGHPRNKERFVDSGGIHQIVTCLDLNPNISKLAVELLFELLYHGPKLNRPVHDILSQHTTVILLLVALLKSSFRESAEKAEAILWCICDDDDDNIVRVAAANWYKPLINRLKQGPESSKLFLAKALLDMELVNENLKALGEEGIVPPLVAMISGNLESKAVSLGVLAKLSACQENKKYIAGAGAVPHVLDLLFSAHLSSLIRESCAVILERLVASSCIEFLVDACAVALDLQHIVTNLLCLQRNPISNHVIRKPALGALLAICKSGEEPVAKAFSNANGISIILPLLADSNYEIQEMAVNLVFCFCGEETKNLVDYLLFEDKLENLVSLLKDDGRADLQVAVLRIVSSLRSSAPSVAHALFRLDALPEIFRLLSSQSSEVKENALGVILLFTNQMDLEIQKEVVRMGTYPLLVNFLKSGTESAKARAAAIMTNLSTSTPKLSVTPVNTGFWCFWPLRFSVCEVHGGVCDTATTFCLLKANALSELVNVLQDGDNAAYAALQALATLVDGEMVYKAVTVLADAGAIYPIMDLLERENTAIKEEALNLLEKIFMDGRMVDDYGIKARILLVHLTGRLKNANLRQKVDGVLALLNRNHKPMLLS